MKRRTLSSQGAGFSKAFQEAAAAQDAGPSSTRAPAPAAAPVCDRSGDVGSTHYWPDGATVGDWCRCGKRKKFLS